MSGALFSRFGATHFTYLFFCFCLGGVVLGYGYVYGRLTWNLGRCCRNWVYRSVSVVLSPFNAPLQPSPPTPTSTDTNNRPGVHHARPARRRPRPAPLPPYRHAGGAIQGRRGQGQGGDVWLRHGQSRLAVCVWPPFGANKRMLTTPSSSSDLILKCRATGG